MKKYILLILAFLNLHCQNNDVYKSPSLVKALCGYDIKFNDFQQKTSLELSDFHPITYRQASVYFKENPQLGSGDGHIVHFLLKNNGTTAVLEGIRCLGRYISPIRKSSYFKLLEGITLLSYGKLYKIDHQDYNMIYGPDEFHIDSKKDGQSSTFLLNLSQFINAIPAITHLEMQNKAQGLYRARYDYNSDKDEYFLDVNFSK